MKNNKWIWIGIIVLVFVVNALRHSDTATSDTPHIYGFDPDTIGSHLPPPAPWIKDTGALVANPMAELKKGLLAETYFCFDHNPDYCPQDDAFLEKIIQTSLDHLNEGKLPQRSNGVKEILNLARSYHSTALESDEGRALMEALVQKRFEHPVVTVGKDWQKTVVVDYGAFPGKLATGARNGFYYKECTHFEASQFNAWRSVEVATELKRWQQQYPTSKAFVLKIHTPRYRNYVYSYFPAITAFLFTYDDGVVHTRHSPTPMQEINPNLSVYISGKESLYQLPEWIRKTDPDAPHSQAEDWLEELLKKAKH